MWSSIQTLASTKNVPILASWASDACAVESAPAKQEANQKDEATIHGRAFLPATDIYENEDALTLVMEMPGVDKRGIEVTLENDVLRVQGRIDFSKYEGLQPVYTEYNIGNYSRSFRLSSTIDQAKISAETKDGVLSLVLAKAEKAKARTIEVKSAG